MEYTLVFLSLGFMWTGTSTEPLPQFYSSFHRQQPPRSAPQDSSFSESQTWTQPLHNYSIPSPNFDFLDPVKSPGTVEILKNNIPRQLGYGAPPPPQPPFSLPPPPSSSQGSGYPQIYKVDNLIIIANPPQQQTCVQAPNYKPLDPNTFPGTDAGVDNRFGNNDEPTKCTWAIVACCAPGNPNVRYNCFELLGCPGFFFDNSPCSPAIVEAATRSALAFYKNANNSTATDNNRL